MTDELILCGHRISPGVSFGPLWVVTPETNEPDDYVASVAANEECFRWRAAREQAEADLVTLEAKARSTTAGSTDQADIFAAHIQLIQDPEWCEQIDHRIVEHGLAAPQAVERVTDEFAAMIAALDDEYMRERAHDIQDVGRRVVNHLLHRDEQDLLPPEGDYILVAHNLTPSQFAALDKKRVLGLVTEVGGVTSHTAIMARLYEIPALSGIEKATERLQRQGLAFLNADKSSLHLNPAPLQQAEYQARVGEYQRTKIQLSGTKDLAAETLDGVAVKLEANIGRESDLQLVLKYGAEGVGLFRTEFLFFDRTEPPSEDEQFRTYCKVVQALAPHDVVIRTFDIGADKQVPYIKWPPEENPFLGLRALRYCLREPLLFQTQLRALLRASHVAPLSIMFPMVSSVEELQAARGMLRHEEEQLRQSGLNPCYRLGIMIEVPSAALIADRLATHVDFFSIGTNDLIQYVCAVDRMNEAVAPLYDSYHPGVLRLIGEVIRAGHAHQIEVAMCGEMAADLELIPLLLGMGLRVFSQSASTVLRSKHLLRRLRIKDCEALAARASEQASGRHIQELCQKFQAQCLS